MLPGLIFLYFRDNQMYEKASYDLVWHLAVTLLGIC